MYWYRAGSGSAAGAAPVTSETLNAYTAAGSGSSQRQRRHQHLQRRHRQLLDQPERAIRRDIRPDRGGQSDGSGSGSGGTVVSSFTLTANGYEDYSLQTTQSAARSRAGRVSDNSYDDDVATDTYTLSDSGGSGASGISGSFDLVSSGSNWSVREIWGSGASGGASDSYNITDDSYSVFNESDVGSPGPVQERHAHRQHDRVRPHHLERLGHVGPPRQPQRHRHRLVQLQRLHGPQ